MGDQRKHHLVQFYELLTRLEHKLGGTRMLLDCSGRMDWPRRGVYFFQEAGELRRDTGAGRRIVRVGTHALKSGSRSTPWGRLSQHKGTANFVGGNHRGSIFRLLVGASLMERDDCRCPSWGQGSLTHKDVREREQPLERAVSATLGSISCLWLAVEDAPGPDSLRGYIERNAIALLSNYERSPLDLPSPGWLGHYSDRSRVQLSGLWNSNHVGESYEPAFLDALSNLIEGMG